MSREDAKNAKIFLEGDDVEDRLAFRTFGAALEVHRTLGPGFLESVYEEALALELTCRGIPFERQCPAVVEYKGRRVGEGRLDFLVDRKVVVELKAVEQLGEYHTAQVLSYLRATNCRLGLLLNFNAVLLRGGMRRVVLSRNSSRPSRLRGSPVWGQPGQPAR
ncbi:MAG TPA: GxxExxY protein [Kofleriaceae bacterium]|nr:GxxExxY protein [Kofleriaceae bacterium]